MAYIEQNKSANKLARGKKKKGPQSAFFKAVQRQTERLKNA